MRKFLNKSLIIATSSLCALSTSVEASNFEADSKMSFEEAQNSAKSHRQRIELNTYKYRNAENEFAGRNAPGTIKKWKDIFINAATAIGSVITGGVSTSSFVRSKGGNAQLGGVIGAAAPAVIIGPTAYRNIKNTWQREELTRNTYALATLEDKKAVAEQAHMLKKAEDNGDLIT